MVEIDRDPRLVASAVARLSYMISFGLDQTEDFVSYWGLGSDHLHHLGVHNLFDHACCFG